MSQVESTLRQVNGRLVGNRNWRLRAYEGWDFRREVLRRQLMEQETRDILPIVNMEGGISEVLPASNGLQDDDFNDDYHDYLNYLTRQQPESAEVELESFFQQVESGEVFNDSDDDDYVNARPGAITFDDNFRLSDMSDALQVKDPRWTGLQDDLDAMQDVHRNFQEHEMYLDGISETHYYHAARNGILAVDRFDLYGDRNPRAWWPILECA